jgi:hypothetical protein
MGGAAIPSKRILCDLIPGPAPPGIGTGGEPVPFSG